MRAWGHAVRAQTTEVHVPGALKGSWLSRTQDLNQDSYDLAILLPGDHSQPALTIIIL